MADATTATPNPIEAYFKGTFRRNQNADLDVAKDIRAFIRWCFDFLRNLLIVGLLQYMAQKTHSVMMARIADGALFLLIGYVWTYFFGWGIRPFHFVKNKIVEHTVAIICTIALFAAAQYYGMIFVQNAVKEIAAANAPAMSVPPVLGD